MNKLSLIWDNPEKESPNKPTSREGLLIDFLNDKNKYLVFSGVSNTRFSDVYTLSRDDWKWTELKPKGEIPKECSYSVCWYDAPYFFFHGGKNKEIALSDTYFLDTDTWLWRKVFTMEQPSPRFHHAAVKAEGKEAYIFGGYDEKRNRCLGDLYRYEYKNLKITSTDNDKVSGSSWINVVQNNDKEKPSNRRGHSMVYHKGSIILYGGMGSNNIIADDNFYRYTIETKQWNIITISGVKPGSRVFHTMNFFKHDSIIIFGGKSKKENEFYVNNDLVYLDINNWDCSTPFIANIGPSPRYGHASSFNSNFKPNEMIIAGGLDKTFCSFDVYLIKEVQIDENKKWVYEHKKEHASVIVNMENKDDIYETAKKTIIECKRQIETLDSQMIQVNKKYSEYFNMMTYNKKSALEDDLNKNEKNVQLKMKKKQLDEEKNELQNKVRELKEYDGLINKQLRIMRERFLLVSKFLEESIDDVRAMDDIIFNIDKSSMKLQLFSSIDIDSLAFKRKNYKNDMENYGNFLIDCSTYERDLFEKVVSMENEQKEKFQNDYYISAEEKQELNFNADILNDSLE